MIFQDGIIVKYHVQVMLLFTKEAEKFSVTHKRPLFRYGCKKTSNGTFLRSNIHPHLSSFNCIFYCVFGVLLYFLSGNFRESCRIF